MSSFSSSSETDDDPERPKPIPLPSVKDLGNAQVGKKVVYIGLGCLSDA